MNWGDRGRTMTRQGETGRPAPGAHPLRRKVMSALASIVNKHRRVLEEHEQVVITTHLDWRQGKLRKTVMALPSSRAEVQGNRPSPIV